MSTDVLLTPRFKTAAAGLPGDPKLWDAALDESDRFAFEMANTDDDHGPFGAQLWLVNEATSDYRLVKGQNSNAVVIKGDAGAHAEAENLSPERREDTREFLQEHRNEGWQIVQVSSGESCPSCRSKQTQFFNELADA